MKKRSRASTRLRREVIERAAFCCEYCRLPQRLCPIPFELDHLVPVADGGATTSENLCAACWNCNSAKNDRIAGRDPKTGRLVALFNPRRQLWNRHFAWNEAGTQITGQTAVGRATVETLDLNQDHVVEFRLLFASIGKFPPADD